MNIITLEDAKRDFPAIGQEFPCPEASDRYQFVSTEKLVESFLKEGATIHSVKAPKTKNNPLFSKHMVRLNIMDAPMKIGEGIPQILIINSHNRTCGLTLHLGIFRLVCSNGLIIADSDFGKFYQKHMNIDINNVVDVINRAIPEFRSVERKIEHYNSIMLSDDEKRAFGREALELIYNESSGNYEINDFLTPRRPEDSVPTLYNTFNVVQENYFKGGILFDTKKGTRKSKAVKSMDRDLNINILLWGLMERFSKGF
jgi:hypothetical protein